MKKLLFSFTLLTILMLVACNNETVEDPATDEQVTLKVASLIPPMTEILDVTKPILAEQGVELEIVVLGDNVQPNAALHADEVDANFFQHKFFMEEYNKNNDADLVAIQQVYYPNFGIYSKNYDSWAALPDGASVAIANDLSNIDRTLQLLATNNLITLGEKTDTYYTLKDVTDNPKNIVFKEVDLLMLARMYHEADAVVMYPSYAAPLGLTPSKDAILVEGEGNDFALQLVTREGNINNDAIMKLKEAITSEEVSKFLNENYPDAATPAF
ncbi:MAG: MetQ/NlpA family ABC transporter substrate-binding protein [Lysinibacillus sp.]